MVLEVKNLLIFKFLIQCKPLVRSLTFKKEKQWGQKLWDGLMTNSQIRNQTVINVCTNQKRGQLMQVGPKVMHG
jgi:hypothetical protein